MTKSRTIAVASGKGGTGKTTIATNLVYSIAKTGVTIQYLDCDVEEPNGHIFLKPDIEKTYSVSISVPDVDTKLCNGCGKCGQLCQYNAIICLKDEPLVFDQLCQSCGGCMLVCPAGAIKEKPREIGFIDLGLANSVKFGQGQLKVGDIHTPSLIKHVKRNAISEGLVIIDVPPGMTCPTVEAIKNTDYVILVTEPTPFGLNDLKLAVEMVRLLDIPFGVVLNRYGAGDNRVEQFCESENIKILLEFPDDRRIAKYYSKGQMIVEKIPQYKRYFLELAESIGL